MKAAGSINDASAPASVAEHAATPLLTAARESNGDIIL